MPYYRKDLRKWQGIVNQYGKRTTKLFTNKKDAEKWESDTRLATHEQRKYTVSEWISEYLVFCKRYVQTVQAEKERVLSRFIQHCGPTRPTTTIDPYISLSFVTAQCKKRTNVAVNKDIAHLKAAWNWGIRFLGLHSPSPLAMIQALPVDKHKAYVPPESDFWKVYDVAEWRDKIMLLTFLYTGARKGEIFRLTWDDVDFDNGTITLSTRKRSGGNMEYDALPMIDGLRVPLMELYSKRTSALLFPSKQDGTMYKQHYHLLGQLCEKAGVKAFSWHAIRRLTASILASSGVPMIQIMAVLRHQNLRTTERYVQPLGMLTDSMSILSKANRSVSRKRRNVNLQLVANDSVSD